MVDPEAGGSVVVNLEFQDLTPDASTLRVLNGMVAANYLSIESLWTKMHEARQLPDDSTPRWSGGGWTG